MKKYVPIFCLIFLLFASQSAAATLTLTWKEIPNPNKIKQISVGNRDNVWGVNEAGEIFKLKGGGWKKQEGPRLKQIAAGRDGTVWGIGKKKQTVEYNFDYYYYGVKGSFCERSREGELLKVKGLETKSCYIRGHDGKKPTADAGLVFKKKNGNW